MAYAPAALRWLAEQWEAAIGWAVFSGIVGDAAHGPIGIRGDVSDP